MKTSQFSDAQGAFILKQGDEGVTVAEICRKAGISQATCFNWKEKYAGMLPPEMKKLKQLEDENARLTKIVADQKMEDWRRDYNEVRPHGAIGNKVLIALMNPGSVTSLPP